MGDQLHLFVFHIPGNLPCNLETLENTEFTLSSEGKKLSVKIAMFIYLFPLPTGKCLMDDAQDLNGAFKVHYLHLPHSLVSLAKIKEKLQP